MAIATPWSNFWDMTSTAGFRVIGSTLSANLATISPTRLVQTADTGQINWTTVSVPAANTAAGYEIWAFTDSTGQTIYYKFEYGQSNNNGFGMWITAGTGSNGSGTITGVLISRTAVNNGQASMSNTTNYPSYMCCTDGCFWMMLGYGSGASTTKATLTAVLCARTCDSSGNITSDGFEWIITSGNTGTVGSSLSCGAWNNSTGYKVSSSNASFCYVPYSITSSNVSPAANYQVFRHEMPMPAITTTAFAGTYLAVEAGAATTTTMALVGSTAHTFFFCGNGLAACAANGITPSTSLALVYE